MHKFMCCEGDTWPTAVVLLLFSDWCARERESLSVSMPLFRPGVYIRQSDHVEKRGLGHMRCQPITALPRYRCKYAPQINVHSYSKRNDVLFIWNKPFSTCLL